MREWIIVICILIKILKSKNRTMHYHILTISLFSVIRITINYSLLAMWKVPMCTDSISFDSSSSYTGRWKMYTCKFTNQSWTLPCRKSRTLKRQDRLYSIHTCNLIAFKTKSKAKSIKVAMYFLISIQLYYIFVKSVQNTQNSGPDGLIFFASRFGFSRPSSGSWRKHSGIWNFCVPGMFRVFFNWRKLLIFRFIGRKNFL